MDLAVTIHQGILVENNSKQITHKCSRPCGSIPSCKKNKDYRYAKFPGTIDTIIIGTKTCDYVVKQIGLSHYDNGERDIYVLTKKKRQKAGRTTFYTGNLKEVVGKLTGGNGKNIYCDGGAELIISLLRDDLIDAFIKSILHVLLSSGIRLFTDRRPEHLLVLIKAKTMKQP